MKLQRVDIRGLKSVASDSLELDRVTLLVGPNGSGKTAVVGAIAYALTGRFPGVVGIDVATLLTLAQDPSKGFMVTLTADKIVIERGVVSGRPHMRVICDGRATEGSKKCDAILAREFGDVQFAADAFDPERSVWRLSPEKRKAWAAELCRGASDWTIERLIKEIGPKNDDWNPGITSDPAAVVELHVARLTAAVTQSQRTGREAGVVADNVAQPEPPTPEDVAAAEQLYDDARAVEQALVVRRNDVSADAGFHAERAKLHTMQREAYATLMSLGEPTPEHEAEIEDADSDALAAEMALDEAAQAHERLASGLRDLQAGQAADVASRVHVGRTGKCPTCGSDAAGAKVELEARMHRRVEDIERFTDMTKAAWATQVSVAERQGALRLRWCTLNEQHAERKRAAADRATADRFLAVAPKTVGAEPPTAADIAVARATLESTRARMLEVRKASALAGERSAQRKAQADAGKREDALKVLLGKMRSVRDQMLVDGISPLRAALVNMGGLAPSWGKFDAAVAGNELVFGIRSNVTGTIVPVETLSAGERYRATVALLLARAIVKREPWVGLFLDALEAVHPADDRNRILRVLSHFAATGVVDNVIAAGAFDPGSIEPVNNMMVHIRFRSPT